MSYIDTLRPKLVRDPSEMGPIFSQNSCKRLSCPSKIDLHLAKWMNLRRGPVTGGVTLLVNLGTKKVSYATTQLGVIFPYENGSRSNDNGSGYIDNENMKM